MATINSNETLNFQPLIDIEHIINQSVIVTIVCLACLFIVFGLGKTLYSYLQPFCNEKTLTRRCCSPNHCQYIEMQLT